MRGGEVVPIEAVVLNRFTLRVAGRRAQGGRIELAAHKALRVGENQHHGQQRKNPRHDSLSRISVTRVRYNEIRDAA